MQIDISTDQPLYIESMAFEDNDVTDKAFEFASAMALYILTKTGTTFVRVTIKNQVFTLAEVFRRKPRG